MEKCRAELERKEDEVLIHLEKRPGSEQCRREIRASSPRAVVNGLALLVRWTAKLLEMREAEVLALVTVELVGDGGSRELDKESGS